MSNFPRHTLFSSVHGCGIEPQAAVLKNRNVTISQQQFDRSPLNLAPLRNLALLTLPTVKL